MTEVLISGSFDNLRSRQVRFLEEAARLGDVHALLWSDKLVRDLEGRDPMFPQEERLYFASAVRYVSQVTLVDSLPGPDALPAVPAADGGSYRAWAVDQAGDNPARRAFCQSAGLDYMVIPDEQLSSFPPYDLEALQQAARDGRKKVLVTGCYDWLHSGHVRFFEEVSQLGDLYVVVGNDANVRHLKGEGHPLFSQDERRYMVRSIRYVKEALITSGWGWMDAEPEILWLKPDIYAVNEDGDKPEKRAFSAEHGLEYVVLKRLPKEGLPRRESTKLRGF